MRKKKVNIPIYYNELLIIQCKDLNKVAKKYNLGNVSKYGAFVFNINYKNGDTKYAVAFSDDVDGSLIAHECVHLVNAIYIDRNIQLDRHNDEPQAYLMGWLFKQCEEFLKENYENSNKR